MGELKAGLLFQYDRIVDTVMDFGKRNYRYATGQENILQMEE